MRYSLVIILLLLAIPSFGQSLHSRSKKAIDFYEQAVELDQFGNYYDSEKLLLEALKKDKSFDEAIVLLHQVYIKRGLFSSSESVFKQSISQLEPVYRNRILLDQAYFLNADGKYEYCRDKLIEIEGPIWQVGQRMFNALKKANDFALAQIENSLDIEFEQLPSPLNKFDLQYFPSITFQNELVFTVRQKVKGGDENLFKTQFDGQNWSNPVQLSSMINTGRNEGTASISGDGKTIVFTACNRPKNVGSCDLYVSYKTEDWSEPEILPDVVNSPEWDSQPSLSSDGRTLYFTSLRDGGFGKQDIWFSKYEKGTWQPAVNLGNQVNTNDDDASPFLYYDDQTLIYASKGRLGMGGFDLYKTELSDKKWSEPKNLGYPINNALDQIGYSLSYDGWAYYSSSLSNGRLVLNRFRIPSDLIKPIIRSVSFTEVEARILKTKRLTLMVYNKEYEQFLLDETYSIPLEKLSGLDSVAFKAKGYQLKKVAVNDLVTNPLVEMEPIKVGQVLLETTGNFDFGSDIVRPELIQELDELLGFLFTNPELVIEVQGHTDLVGTTQFNYQLSLARAQNVANYLMENGLTEDRVSYVGFGETRPKVNDISDTELSVNRRVEVVVKGFKE